MSIKGALIMKSDEISNLRPVTKILRASETGRLEK